MKVSRIFAAVTVTVLVFVTGRLARERDPASDRIIHAADVPSATPQAPAGGAHTGVTDIRAGYEPIPNDRWESLGRDQQVFPVIAFNLANLQSGTARVFSIEDVRESDWDAAGRRERCWLVRTDLHHPWIRVVDTLERDAGHAGERLIGRVAMVADHAILSFSGGEPPSAFDRSAFLTRERLMGTDFYLVSFAAADADALPAALDRLRGLTSAIRTADADFVSYTMDMPVDAAVVTEPGDDVVVEGEDSIPADMEWAAALPSDSGFGSLWGLRNTGQIGGAVAGMDINAANAWDVRTDASSVVVGVIDTGIRTSHADLSGNLWANAGEMGVDGLRRDKSSNGVDDDGNGYIDDVFGINAVTNRGMNGGTVNDDHGHGTHCAGTIGARGNNGAGVTGVCWRVKLMALKFMAASGSGFDSDAIECLAYARNKGAKVTSNSWGGGGYNGALLAAIQQARDADVLFIAAAGNAGRNNDVMPTYPCGYNVENVIAVAAMDPSGSRASYSNYGATTVDVAAPGSQVYSTDYSGNTNYSWKSGTSMATPHVAGIAALMRAHLPTADYAVVRARLLAKTNAMGAWSGVVAQGGRIDAYRCIAEDLPQSVMSATALAASRGGSVSVSVAATDPLGGALTYQWRKAGVNVVGATAATLAIGDMQASDAGHYDCLVTNATGSVATAVVSIGLKSGADFDGDGTPDLLWSQASTGRRVLWLMDGTARMNVAAVELGTVPTDWALCGAADFDGNGSPDLIWSQASTGRRVLWLMNGTTKLNMPAVELGTVPRDWTINGAADFDRNGSPDLIWTQAGTGRRVLWLMNGITKLNVPSVELGTVSTDWTLHGAADLDGNGSPDLIWTQGSTGRRVAWPMAGTSRLAGPSIELGTVSTQWRLEGTGDFDGNGRPDIIWTNRDTGRRVVWLMDGTTRGSLPVVELGTVAVDWSIHNR